MSAFFRNCSGADRDGFIGWHPVHARETFVDRSRFKGTRCHAANWLRVGQVATRFWAAT